MEKVAVAEVARQLDDFWSQKVIGRANGNLFKVAKGIASTTWHSHDDQEETFYVLVGTLTIQLRDRNIVLTPGDLFVVPRGVEHCPFAEHEVHFMVIGPDVTSTAAGGKPEWHYRI